MSAARRSIVFMTGNANKLREVQQILPDFDIEHHKLDLLEIQGTPDEIVRAKVKQAFSHLKRPVIVEDTSLSFDAMKGLPGPYIKYFLENLGPSGLHQMLAGFADKSAKARCLFAYQGGEDAEPVVFEGICEGSIVAPRHSTPKPFGWDPVFEPKGFNKTFGEMTPAEKNAISHRSRALAKLTEYFRKL